MRRTTCPTEWSDKYKGQFDQGWDALREEIVARQKELGVVPAGDRADRSARGDSRLGRHARRAQARARPADGDLRRLPRAHRPPRRPARGRARGPRGPRGHARLLHHRRQRRERRGDDQRDVQRDVHLQRRRRAGDAASSWPRRSTSSARPTAYNHYAVGWAHAMDTPYQWTKQVASHWGGTRNGTIVHWPNGIGAQGRDALAVPPRDRRRADGARGGRAARAEVRQRRRAEADRGREHALRLRRRGRAPSATRRSTSRCSATAASTTRAGPRSRATRRRG